MKQNIDFNFNFCLVGEQSITGRVRRANEDSKAVFTVANMKVFVVCDGMGGHVGGKTASETAIIAIREFLLNNITIDPREAIHNAVMAANEAILNKARQQPELAGMGSTCVLLLVTSDGKVYYGHVGDSRIYIIANHRITQLTKDHSYVQTLVDAGQITKEQAEHHPRKNEITNALGIPSMQPPTVCSAPIEPDSGNCFLLCSDGLTGMVSDKEIEKIVSKHEISIQQRADTLVEMANNNGGVDNITVELVEFAIGTQEISYSGKKKTDWKKWLLYLLPVLVVLCGLAYWLVPKYCKTGKTSETITANQDTSKIEAPVVEQNLVPKIYNTSPSVVFSANAKIMTKIIDFQNDLIISGSEKYNSKIFRIENIDEDGSITLKWTARDFKGDTLTVTCETAHWKSCTIKIPVERVTESTQSLSILNSDTVITKNCKWERKADGYYAEFTFDNKDNIDATGLERLSDKFNFIKTNRDDIVKCDVAEGKIEFYIEKNSEIPEKIILKGKNKKGKNATIKVIIGQPGVQDNKKEGEQPDNVKAES